MSGEKRGVGTFRGKPLQECTREELYECINSIYDLYEDGCRTHEKTMGLLGATDGKKTS